MAKLRVSAKKISIAKFKVILESLQKSFPLSKILSPSKEGHFAVIAAENGEYKKFTVPLSYLTQPLFMRLLEQAAEEFGFKHGGVLTLPCNPSDLEKILA